MMHTHAQRPGTDLPRVRPAESHDLPEVQRLLHRQPPFVQPPLLSTSASALLNSWQRGDHEFWVAERPASDNPLVDQTEGRLLGFLGAHRESQHVARVGPLRVRGLWQDTALPLLLTYAVLQHYRDQGVVKVKLGESVAGFAVVEMLAARGGILAAEGRSGERHATIYPNLYHDIDPATLCRAAVAAAP